MRSQFQTAFLATSLAATIGLSVSLAPLSHAQIEPRFFSEPPTPVTQLSGLLDFDIGDIDFDGDLDLIYVNGTIDDPSTGDPNGRIELYLNSNPGFVRSEWTGDDPVHTNSVSNVVLGDIDGDGDLDVVLGRPYDAGVNSFPLAETLVLNHDGQLADTPTWSWPSAGLTRDLLLGDVNNDGYLDLVVLQGVDANLSGGHDFLFLGTAGGFEQDHAWKSARILNSQSGALLDMNSDGLLDLLVSTRDGGSDYIMLFEGLGTEQIFPAETAETGDLPFGNRIMAFADMNGDGLMDLVHSPGPIAVHHGIIIQYLNVDGTVTGGTVAVNSARRFAIGDVNLDGKLDIVYTVEVPPNIVHHVLLNQDGQFPDLPTDSPDWSSKPIEDQRSFERNNVSPIRLADMDGDGDLDIVSGKLIYWNVIDPISTIPQPIGTQSTNTQSIAVGDVESDDDIDVAFGNRDQQVELYINSGGQFLDAPAIHRTTDNGWVNVVALEDLGDDGKLDIIAGGPSGIEGFRDVGPAGKPRSWGLGSPLEPFGADVRSLAFAQVNADLRLDMFYGASPQGDGLVLSGLAGFPESPAAWTTQGAGSTVSIASGDIDGDGLVDLVSAEKTRVLVYTAVGAGAPGMATQEILLGWDTLPSSVALGDLDGDGDLDVCVGIQNGRDVAFANQGGLFNDTESLWTAQDYRLTKQILLRDLNADGDLDITSFAWGSMRVYLNKQGTLSPGADHELTRQVLTGRVVEWADLDRDGDLDLVSGNWAAPNEFYKNQLRPVYKGHGVGLATPIYHEPNNSAYVALVSAQPLSTNQLAIQFTALDVESDPIWIFPEFQFEGEGSWRPLIPDNPVDNRVGPFSSSPDGVLNEFVWDFQSFPFDSRDVVLKINVISHPRRGGEIRHVDRFDLPLGKLQPVRPQIGFSQSSLVLPTVTVGDTSVVDVDVLNEGSSLLTISSVQVPLTEISAGVSTPFTVDAQGSKSVPFSLAPTSAISDPGTMTISSDDPLTPVSVVPIQVDVRELEFDTSLLSPFDPLPLGEAVTIVVRPKDQVNVEKGSLFYRSRGSIEFIEIALARQQNEFVATIPGADVTELGLEYYLRVENSGIEALDPPDAPTSLHERDVQAANEVVLLPLSGQGGSHAAGQNVAVEVRLPTGADLTSGTLSYRQGGQSSYESAAVVPSQTGFQAAIPSSAVTARGLEYWVEVQTKSGATITAPRSDPQSSPYVLQVTVSNLVEPESRPGKEYRLLSVPLGFSTPDRNLEDMLSEQPEFGPYDPLQWRTYRYLSASGTLVEFPDDTSAFEPIPGRGFWLISRGAHQVDTRPLEGLSNSTESPYPIHLDPGWNQIGNPFAFPVAWENIVPAAPKAFGPPHAFDSAEGGWSDATVLMPFEGYFVHNSDTVADTLWIPPSEADLPLVTKQPLPAHVAMNDGWLLKLGTHAQSTSTNCFVGVTSNAALGHDPEDRLQPPVPPGLWTTLSIDNRSREQRPGLYRRDVRSSSADGHSWELVLHTVGSGERAELYIEADAIPPGWGLLLVDTEQGSQVSESQLRSGYPVVGYGIEKAYRLSLHVGSEEYIQQTSATTALPSRVALGQNAPNPFNPVTRIRFGLPTPSSVSLRIYNVRGELVASPIDRQPLPAGYHTALWNGKDHRGQPAASGVYVYRLIAGAETLIRRMVLLK